MMNCHSNAVGLAISLWAIAEQDADDKANDMHEAVVAELSRKLEEGLEEI